jgi:hypothetical protein
MADFQDQACPEELRLAFLEMLRSTLISIRNNAHNSDYCLALADHTHNIPSLLARYSPDLLRFYWEVEVPCFVATLERIGEPPPALFRERWEPIEREYLRLDPG